MKHFSYKGYTGSAKISIEDSCLYGKVEHISDLITYEADTIEQLEIEFKNAVDSYLNTCQEVGLTPKKPFKGSVNVKLNPEIHDKVFNKAETMGKSISEYIADIVIKDVESHA